MVGMGQGGSSPVVPQTQKIQAAKSKEAAVILFADASADHLMCMIVIEGVIESVRR